MVTIILIGKVDGMRHNKAILSIHHWDKTYKLKLSVDNQSFQVGDGNLTEIKFIQKMMAIALRKTGATVVCRRKIGKFLYE